MRTKFFCTSFLNTGRAPGHPGKIPGTSRIPLFETQGRQSFEGGHEVFGHHPFTWKTPTRPGGLRTQKLNLCALFSCLISRGPNVLRLILRPCLEGPTTTSPSFLWCFWFPWCFSCWGLSGHHSLWSVHHTMQASDPEKEKRRVSTVVVYTFFFPVSGDHSLFSVHRLFPQGFLGVDSRVLFATRMPDSHTT